MLKKYVKYSMLYVTKTELMKRNEKAFYFDRCRERL